MRTRNCEELFRSHRRTVPGNLLTIVWLALMGFAVLGVAQGRPGGLRGYVTDPSGAAIARAAVTAIPAGPGPAQSVTTDRHGMFAFANLPPGRYTVAAQAPGFAVLTRQDVRVTAGDTTNLTLSLPLMTARQQVVVQAQAAQVAVAPENNASAVVIQGSDLKALSNDPDELLTELQELAGPAVGPNSAEIYIDGFTGGDLPPKSAIRAIRVNQNPFSAAYDRLGYGRVEILTKPGSAAWHGGVSLQSNSSALNSASPFLAGASQPPYRSWLYGGELGGPLGRAASFYLALERRDINRDNLVNAETLTPSLTPQALVEAVPNPRLLTNVSPRFDVQLTPENTLTLHYDYYGVTERNAGVGGQSLASQASTLTRGHHLLEVGDMQVLGPHLINETRFQYLHFNNRQETADFGPTLQVLGAFTGGGNSGGALARSESHYELQDLASLNLGAHYLQIGGFVRDIRRSEDTDAGFNGTFTFNSLALYQSTLQDLAQGMTMAQIRAAGFGPSQFDITTGHALAGVNRLDGTLFAQDDWKLRPNLTASTGLRFESQNAISDHADWAPRLGLSWGLGHGSDVRTVVRAGLGVFYDRLDDDQMMIAERLNGANQLSYVVPDPAFFPAIPPLSGIAGANSAAPTVYRIAPNLQAPYAIESALGVERQVARNITVSATYLHSLGKRQLLSNDINAPLPGTYNPADPTSGVRPLGAAAGNVVQYESAGKFVQNQLIANTTVRRGKVSLFGYYVLNQARSDTAGADSFPANPWNIAADYGRSNFSVRHRVFLGGSVALPFGIDLYPVLTARSGLPFSITLGEDLYGTGIHNGRPAPSTAATPAADLRITPYGSFDVQPNPSGPILPPNTATGPAAWAVNLRATRTFGFGARTGDRHGAEGGDGGGDGGRHRNAGLGGRGLGGGGGHFNAGGTERRYALTIGVSARNVFNHVNLGTPVGNLNSPVFGRSLSLAGGPYSSESGGPRRLDLHLELNF